MSGLSSHGISIKQNIHVRRESDSTSPLLRIESDYCNLVEEVTKVDWSQNLFVSIVVVENIITQLIEFKKYFNA